MSGRESKAGDLLRLAQPALDRLSTPMCLFDQAMTVVCANEAFCKFADGIVAKTLDEHGGEAHAGAAWGLLLVAAGDDAAAVRAGVEAVKSGESPLFTHEYRVSGGGSPRFFALRAQACELSGQKTILIEQTDVTTRRLLESRLLWAERAQGAQLLASVIAHDINNLLLVISGYTDLVGRGLSAESSAADLEEISRAIKNVSALTQQLLAMRPGAERSSTVRVNQAIKDLSRLLCKLVGEDVSVELQLDEEVGRIQCETPLVQQVLSNLVRNASEAMSGGGQVVVSTHNLVVGANKPVDTLEPAPDDEIPPGHWVVIRVHDTGSGMDDTILQRALEPFVTTKVSEEGAGLGLWVVSEIVRRAQGHVRLSSQKGVGTTVDVYFPGLESVVGSRFTSSLAPAAPRATVLVVEDNHAVRELLQRVLRGAGYHVLVAAGPSEARTLGEGSTQPIHLLLTDVVMSDMSGPLLARELKRTRPELAVVLMSGYSASTYRQREQELPDAVFLEKPFTASHVLRTVEEALAASGQAPVVPRQGVH